LFAAFVSLPFFADFATVPAGRVNCTVQPLTVTVPGLLTVYCSKRFEPRASSTSYVARSVGVAVVVAAIATAVLIARVPAPRAATNHHRRDVAM
jgi:hypothetical protein